MKIFMLIMPLIAALSLNVSAQQVLFEDVDMSVAKHKKSAKHSVKQLITKHMLENGFITQAEIDEQKESRKAAKEELRQLKLSGDKEALKARVQDLRQEKRARQQAMKEYVANNEDLSEAIREHRQMIRESKKERKKERKQKLKDKKLEQQLEGVIESEDS